MSSTQTIRIVNYAVNGSGVGHLTRLVAINRWIRRYTEYLGVRAEIWFLTSSEAEGLLFAERFASFKLPSKTIVGEAGIDKLAYLALAKQWVWHSLGLLRPDLLIVDTFPRGSFGELLSALDLAKRRAFVYRPMKEAFARRADFQAMLPLYDAIIVPAHEDDAPLPVPDGVRRRVRHVGPVISRERSELLPREEARRLLGVGPGIERVVYVSAGGGGDVTAEAHIDAACALLAGRQDVHVVVGAGPLYRGRPRFGPRTTWLTQPGSFELANGFDLAIVAAGYNTFHEMMLAGVPSIFLPQEKIADEQAKRADRAVRAGAAKVVDASLPLADAIASALAGWDDAGALAAAAAAARTVVPDNHARDAALEMLRLVLPSHAVDAAEEALDDALLASTSELGLAIADVTTLMRCLEGSSPDEEPARVSSLALELVRTMKREGVAFADAMRVVEPLCKKLVAATAEERAAAASSLLAALVPFADWPGAGMLVRAFGAERRLSADELAREATLFLGRLRARGEDLYRGIAWVAKAQESAGDVPTNLHALRADA
jgi:predicted glycosyltransferase